MQNDTRRLHAFIFGSRGEIEVIFFLSSTPTVHFFDQPDSIFNKRRQEKHDK